MVFDFFKLVLSFSKSYNSSKWSSWPNMKYPASSPKTLSSRKSYWSVTRHEESIKARLCFAFQVSWILYFSNHFITILYKPWISLNFFFFFVPKAFWSFLVFQTLKTCAIHPFHSLLPLPKRICQGLTAWILFVSLFSLFQKNKGLTAWILLCLPSPLSKNSKRHSLRILLILPFP